MTEFLAPLCLVAFFLFTSSTVIGLTMEDDAYYLQSSPLIHLGNFLQFKDWGALYLTWLHILGVFVHNPIQRSFISWGLLVVCVSLIPLWMKTPSAWIYTCIVIVIPCLTIYPYVSLLAAAILLCGLCFVMRRQRSCASSAAAACITCFVLSFVRPEFTYGLYVAAAATLLAFFVETAAVRRRRTLALAQRPQRWAAIVAVSLSAAMLLIGLHAPRSRSGRAFAEHYAWRAAERGLIPPGPNTWNSDYAARRFGLDAAHDPRNGTASLGDFFHANPRLFLGHLWHNLEDPHCSGFILLIIGAAIIPWCIRRLNKWRSTSFFFLLLSLPPLISTVVIFPRAHYMIILFPALIIYALQLTGPMRWSQPNPLWLVPCCALIWIVNHNRIVGLSDEAKADRVSLHQVQCTYAEDAKAPASSHVVFSSLLLLPAYLPHARQIVSPDAVPTLPKFEQWVKTTHPAWVSTNDELAQRYGTTPNDLDEFLHSESRYTAYPCPADAKLTVYRDTPQ